MPFTRSKFAERARSISVWAALLGLPFAAACEALAGKTTACDGLVYKKGGPARRDYLPCAGEMVETLDRLAPQIDRMLSGDAQARSEASASGSDLRGLLKKAGGLNLLERWNDRALTNLNGDTRVVGLRGPYDTGLVIRTSKMAVQFVA